MLLYNLVFSFSKCETMNNIMKDMYLRMLPAFISQCIVVYSQFERKPWLIEVFLLSFFRSKFTTYFPLK